MKDVEVRVLAIRPSLEVLIAKHKDSQYFIANGEDITEFVTEVVGKDDWSKLREERVVEMAYANFIQRHGRKIIIPQFDFVILDSARTHLNVLVSTFVDVWHHTPEKALAVSYEVDEFGEAVLGTYTFEHASCFGRMIDMVCDQLDHEIKYKINKVDSIQRSMNALDGILKDK